VANINGITPGQMESGFTQSDVAFWAYTGTGVYEGKPKVADLRLIANLYPETIHLVARKGANIRSVADLRGKRVTVPRNTSAYYFLVRMLESAGLKESDVIAVNVPADQMASAVVNGQADAISMWEPEAQSTMDALGRDAVVFQDNRLYRELFSLYSTTEVMRDPRRRSELVAFVRALEVAATDVTARPREYFPLIARVIKQPVDRVARSWEHHRFPAAMPADMLDVMVHEEAWLARSQQRPPRTRTQLASFLDTSILEEALRK
jgi:sulfonate transport system substrate-binding protein